MTDSSMKTMIKNCKNKHYCIVCSLLITLAGLCLAATSCSSDDDVQVPNYIVELVEIDTNKDTLVTVIRTDNGTTYNVTQTIVATVPDTTYRCLCSYAFTDKQLTIYSLSVIFSEIPMKAELFKVRPTDPVKFVSCWKSGRYLNLQIGIKTTDADYHKYAFSEDSIVTKGTSKTVFFTLLHQRPVDDDESYTKDTYLSIPISSYTDCDSFAISVNTYEGLRQVIR